jgi:hypothetical protein
MYPNNHDVWVPEHFEGNHLSRGRRTSGWCALAAVHTRYIFTRISDINIIRRYIIPSIASPKDLSVWSSTSKL